MSTVATAAVAIVAVIHVAIAAVEMLFWETPVIYERLNLSAEVAKQVTPIVQNAGLYNGFIAAGLMWSILTKASSLQIRIFFLVCVAIAGMFGAFTLRPTTFLLQTVPALVALVLVVATHYQSKS